MGGKIKNSNELEFVVFCIENVATKSIQEKPEYLRRNHYSGDLYE